MKYIVVDKDSTNDRRYEVTIVDEHVVVEGGDTLVIINSNLNVDIRCSKGQEMIRMELYELGDLYDALKCLDSQDPSYFGKNKIYKEI